MDTFPILIRKYETFIEGPETSRNDRKGWRDGRNKKVCAANTF